MASQGKRRRRKTDKAAPEAPRLVLKLVDTKPAGPEPVAFTRVDPEWFGAALVAAAAHLEKACARTGGRYSLATVAQGVRDESLQLWLALTEAGDVRAVVITHRGRYDTGLKVLQILLAAGAGLAREDVVQAIAYLKAFAAEKDCHRLEFHGARKGWLRWLRKLGALNGFNELGVCGEMEI